MTSLPRLVRPPSPLCGVEWIVNPPLPASDAELEILSSAFFTRPLHLSKLRVVRLYRSDKGDIYSAEYEVREKFNSYDPLPWVGETWGKYDFDEAFWRRVIGRLTCGGVAGHSYGQVRGRGYRQMKRLQTWALERDGTGGSSTVRPQFKRLAARLRELREQV